MVEKSQALSFFYIKWVAYYEQRVFRRVNGKYSSIFMDVVYKDKSFIIDRILGIARRL